MNPRRPLRQTVGSIAVVCLLILFLVGTRWSSIQNAVCGFESLQAPMASSVEPESPADGSLPEHLAADRWEIYTSMPACVDLQDSIHALADARNRLLRQATDADAASLQRAGADYRQAIEQVRTRVARLRARVSPDVFPELAVELLNGAAGTSGQSLWPWEIDAVMAGDE